MNLIFHGFRRVLQTAALLTVVIVPEILISLVLFVLSRAVMATSNTEDLTLARIKLVKFWMRFSDNVQNIY